MMFALLRAKKYVSMALCIVCCFTSEVFCSQYLSRPLVEEVGCSYVVTPPTSSFSLPFSRRCCLSMCGALTLVMGLVGQVDYFLGTSFLRTPLSKGIAGFNHAIATTGLDYDDRRIDYLKKENVYFLLSALPPNIEAVSFIDSFSILEGLNNKEGIRLFTADEENEAFSWCSFPRFIREKDIRMSNVFAYLRMLYEGGDSSGCSFKGYRKVFDERGNRSIDVVTEKRGQYVTSPTSLLLLAVNAQRYDFIKFYTMLKDPIDEVVFVSFLLFGSDKVPTWARMMAHMPRFTEEHDIFRRVELVDEYFAYILTHKKRKIPRLAKLRGMLLKGCPHRDVRATEDFVMMYDEVLHEPNMDYPIIIRPLYYAQLVYFSYFLERYASDVMLGKGQRAKSLDEVLRVMQLEGAFPRNVHKNVVQLICWTVFGDMLGCEKRLIEGMLSEDKLAFFLSLKPIKPLGYIPADMDYEKSFRKSYVLMKKFFYPFTKCLVSFIEDNPGIGIPPYNFTTWL